VNNLLRTEKQDYLPFPGQDDMRSVYCDSQGNGEMMLKTTLEKGNRNTIFKNFEDIKMITLDKNANTVEAKESRHATRALLYCNANRL
jgi:hypothetical protein